MQARLVLPVVLLFSVLSSGCKPLIRMANGESRPKPETISTLERFIAENQLPIDIRKCLFLKDRESKRILSSLHGYDHGYYVAVPNMFAYGADFCIKDQSRRTACLPTPGRPYPDGPDFYQDVLELPVGESDLEAWKGAFTDYRGLDYFPFGRNGKAKVIILWSKYKGKGWAEDVAGIIATAKASTASFELFYLNMDEFLIPDTGH